MPIVLTVDDSSSIRSIVGKALRELGFELAQAEDGEKGLALLAETKVDLILLDVTMPVMDGPTMLKALRARGDKTPVIMLTSESKRAIVAGAIQLGIEDYMLKPFKPDELRTKVFKALRLSAAAPIAANSEVRSAPATAPVGATAASPPSKPSVDVLIVDDMDNVHKRFRQTLPAHITMQGTVSARDAVSQCQDKAFRLILVDLVMPDVNSVALMNQLRALQPQAAFVALVLRGAADPRTEITAAGFADYLFKPFDPEATTELLGKFFEHGALLAVDGNVLIAAGFDGGDDKLERYYARLWPAVKAATAQLAEACHDQAIFDLRSLPLSREHTTRMIGDLARAAHNLGLRLCLVGTHEAGWLLRRVPDLAEVPFYESVERARGKAA